MPRARYSGFTPDEQAAIDVFHDLGDAARRGLHLSERVAGRMVARAHAEAAVVGRIVRARTRRSEGLK